MKKNFRFNSWQVFFGGFLLGAVLTLITTTTLNFISLGLSFSLHITVGLSITFLLTDHFQYPLGGAIQGKLPSILGIAIFGLSDFIWGGIIFGNELKTLLIFSAFAGLGFFIIFHGRQRIP